MSHAGKNRITVASYNSYEYRQASHQKFKAAVDADGREHYAVSHYLSGVAIECMLRAYRWSIDPSWDAKHDLRELMKKSGVLARLPENKQGQVRDALVEIAVRWSISHRYAPDDRLEAYLKKTLGGGSPRILKDNSDYMLNRVEFVLAECDKKCP